MARTSEIVISLNRRLSASDEKAVSFLMSQWLVYDVRINRRRASTEIRLFHTEGAAHDLFRKLARLFPNENLRGN